MNRERSAKSAPRGHNQPKTPQQVSVQKKKRDRGGPCSADSPPAKEGKLPGSHRKLSDASNASEDLSKDSGCVSGKLSSSDSSSEISDCTSEGNKNDPPSSDHISWVSGGAYVSPGSAGGALFTPPGAFIELMMGETTEDLVRELEDLRSENEYLKVSLQSRWEDGVPQESNI